MMTWSKRKTSSNRKCSVKPYCDCFEDRTPSEHLNGLGCKCGENVDVKEWRWETPPDIEESWVQMSDDHRQVTFHPYYSSGTAVVKGSSPLQHDHHYYWEIKMLSEPYGTDIMIGLGTDKVDVVSSRYRFISLLGQNVESYGLSYKGILHHDGLVIKEDTGGFCRGSIVGVKVDLWQGTLEYFVNRQPKGISFFNLRRHPSMTLFPMLCSTAAQSCMRLIYASSWQASLLADAAKILGASANKHLVLPPGLKNKMKTVFWLLYPDDSCIVEDQERESRIAAEKREMMELSDDDIPYMGEYNAYYTDSIAEDHRIALIYDL